MTIKTTYHQNLLKQIIDMKNLLRILILLLVVAGTSVSSYGQCSSVIKEETTFGDIQIVKTNWQYLVLRGGYSYGLELVHNEKGIKGIFTSKGGVSLEQGNDIMFLSSSGVRKIYKFVDFGEMDTESGQPVYTNTLELDIEAIRWFATNTMATIYIRNNTTLQMRKFSVNPDRKNEFQNFASCFLRAMSKGKINSTKVIASPTGPSKKTSPSDKPVSSGSDARPKEAKSDAELDGLYKDLSAMKAKVREEIQKEREKGDKANF